MNSCLQRTIVLHGVKVLNDRGIIVCLQHLMNCKCIIFGVYGIWRKSVFEQVGMNLN